MRHRKLASLIGIGVLTALLCSCTASTSLLTNEGSLPPADHSSSAKVVVTSDFGKEIFIEETIVISENTTALDALQQVAGVETKYGGGFVSAINSIGSEYEGANQQKKDWFFYINGMSTNIGAGQYILQDGDIEHWDFRGWGFRQFVPAIIGDFPEPFLHGYGGVVYPTIIIHQDGWEEDAQRIADKLSQLGVESIYTRGINELSTDEKSSCNLILLGESNFQPIEEINQPWNRLGFYCYFEDSCLQVFDSVGESAAEYEGKAGIIQATQSPWNPKGIGVCENVVWMVSGLDKAGIKAAVNTLVNHDNDFQYTGAIVIASGDTVRVPQ